MKYTFYFFFILINNFIFCQTKISGNIEFEKDSISSLNFLIINKNDSSVFKTFIINDKQFNFEVDRNLDSNFYFMLLSEEYNELIIPITQIQNHFDLGVLNLKKAKSIEEVTIKKRKRIIVQEEDKLIVNVENTIVGNSNTVLELLGKIPSVQVQNNNISIVGIGNALIYLNSRRINIERLQSIPVSRIQKIEVITNPSAIYDASGNAVINIVTKVNTSEGVQCQLNETFTIAKHNLNLTSINTNYKKGKLSIYSDFSKFYGTDWGNTKATKSINLPSDVINSNTNITEQNKNTNVLNYRYGMEYQLTKNNLISLQYDGDYNKLDLNTSSISRQERLNNNIDVSALNTGRNLSKNNSINLNFSSSRDSLGSLLFIGAQYSDFNANNKDLIFENISGKTFQNSSNKNNIGNNNISLFVTQVDYTKVLKNALKFEMGYKYAENVNASSFEFKTKQENAILWETYPQFSNSILYKEKINAFYLQMNKTIGPLMFQLGNRTELSKIDSRSVLLDKKYVDTFYTNFFPTMKIGYKLSSKLRFVLSFSSRIIRPTYQDFDPFILYADTLMAQTGNTKLVPEKKYNIEFKTMFLNYSWKISYVRVLNPILTIPQINNTSSILFKQNNGGSANIFLTSLNLPFEFKNFQSINTVTFSYVRINTSPYVSSIKSSPKLYFYSYNSLNIKDKMNIDMIFDYNSSFSNGYLSFKPMYSLGVGVSKHFFDKNLNVNVNINDCLRTYYEGVDQNISIFKLTSHSNSNTFFIRFSLSYKFGKLKELTYSNKSIGDNEIERIKK